ncbi:MAG: galactose oxidase-like domain-containing protein [Phycisphaerales bacterium]
MRHSRSTRATTTFVLLLALPAAARADGTVEGLIQAASQPVPSARITVFTPNLSYFAETHTSATGAYGIGALPDGTYRLGVASLGRGYQEIGITIAGSSLIRNFTLAPETEPGRWDIIGTTLPEFFDATDIAILTPQGKVFFCHDTMDPVLFDPVTGQNTFPPGSGLPQGCMNSTHLADGRLLLVGGQEGDEPGNFRLAVRWVKAFDPLTSLWERLADLQHPTGRWYPGLARLADGSVLAMGGGTRPNAVRTETCERLDLTTLTWSYTGSMLNPSEFTPSALLHTGEVLITWSPPQLYNPASGQWRATGNFVQPNRGWPDHSDHSMVVLADGRALALGIRRGGAGYTGMGEVYNPQTESWSLTGPSALPRYQSEVVHLPDGRVLVAGGDISNQMPASPTPNTLGCVKWSELYDPATNAFRRVADMNWFREYHAVSVLVPDGRVVMTGGTRIKFQVGPFSADIEGFVPPYLLRGVRPQINAISTATLRRGDPLSLDIFPATTLTSVVLMGVQTHTHWVQGGNARHLVLPVQQTGSNATATLPVNPDVLPLGFYMAFAMVDDIPSVARIVQVVASPACYANCDQSTTAPVLNVQDFGCFLARYAAGEAYANCDNSTTAPVLNVQDFGCFLTRYAGGCP